MKNYKIIDLLDEVLSGEWGQEPSGDHDVKVIRTTNFSNDGQLNLEKEVVYRNISEKKVEKKKLRYGDIIIEKSGGSPDQPVGRVVYFDIEDDDTYLCNNFTSVLRPNKSKVFSRYLFYFLFFQHKIRSVLKYQNKTTGIINLKLESYITKTEIKLPDFETQKKIVKSLDISMDLIKKRKAQIEALDQLTQSVFLGMFGDVARNPKKYPKAIIKDFGTVVTGNTPSKKIPEYYGDYIEWIKSDNINTPSHYLTPALEYLSELGIKKGREVPSNSILVTCIAGSKSCIGNAAIANRRVSFNQQINAIIPKSDVDTQFLYTQFLVGKRLVQQASTNGMKGLVSKSSFEKIEFIKPPYQEQKKFGEIFIKIENQKQYLIKSMVMLEINLNSLMQRAFKGELFTQEKLPSA